MIKEDNHKVLWIDDEYYDFPSVMEDFYEKGNIDINGFTNAEEALNELNVNHFKYDAIILDGLFYEKKQDEISEKPNRQVALATVLNMLAEKKTTWGAIPFFIYSGKTKIHNLNDNDILESYKIDKVYKKNNKEDFNDLCLAIKSSDKQSNNIKLKYRQLFNILESKQFSADSHIKILQFLKNDFNPVNGDISEDFNCLRKILEELFIKYYEYGVLHPDYVDVDLDIVKIPHFSNALNFLSGNTKNLIYSTNPPLKNSFNSVHFVWGNGSSESHFSKKNILGLKNDVYKEYLINKLSAMTHCVIDLIYEFDFYVIKNTDKEENKKQWTKSKHESERQGQTVHLETVICQDANDNYFCTINGENHIMIFRSIEPEEGPQIYKIGQKINVTKTDKNKKPETNRIYDKIVINFN
jgi:hypothetical protein